jgi:hypothetical protein
MPFELCQGFVMAYAYVYIAYVIVPSAAYCTSFLLCLPAVTAVPASVHVCMHAAKRFTECLQFYMELHKSKQVKQDALLLHTCGYRIHVTIQNGLLCYGNVVWSERA